VVFENALARTLSLTNQTVRGRVAGGFLEGAPRGVTGKSLFTLFHRLFYSPDSETGHSQGSPGFAALRIQVDRLFVLIMAADRLLESA
jgi:hypothetical protein